MPIARSAGLPAASVQAQQQEFLLIPGNQFATAPRQFSTQSQLTVPLFRGGGVRSAILGARTRVESGQAQLRRTEAELFADVVTAYMNVIRDEAVVALNGQNVRVLEVNLRASRDRFEVGDLTRTDVAQSEARLALARAQLQQVGARLIASREEYIQVVGTPPGVLEEPPVLTRLPADPDQAVTIALTDNPTLVAARNDRTAARFDVGVARAERLPQLDATLGGQFSTFLGSVPAATADRIRNSTTAVPLGASAQVPLYQGGRPAALVRQAQARESQAIEGVTSAERDVITQTRSAFAAYRGSLQVIRSSETAVGANRLALEGVRAENSVGTRSVLDVLDAEQELLNSQVTLVSARRDAYVAGFTLIAAMGKAEADALDLGGRLLYDPEANFQRVSRRISDFGSDASPHGVATGTANTPAQGSEVRRSLDPLVSSSIESAPALTKGASVSDGRP